MNLLTSSTNIIEKAKTNSLKIVKAEQKITRLTKAVRGGKYSYYSSFILRTIKDILQNFNASYKEENCAQLRKDRFCKKRKWFVEGYE
jgi:hypothetical protein